MFLIILQPTHDFMTSVLELSFHGLSPPHWDQHVAPFRQFPRCPSDEPTGPDNNAEVKRAVVFGPSVVFSLTSAESRPAVVASGCWHAARVRLWLRRHAFRVGRELPECS